MTEKEIKDLMKEKNLTASELARRFEVSHTAIHFLIKRQLKSEELEKRLARALGVKLEKLRGEGQAA